MSDTRTPIALWVGFDASWKIESAFPRKRTEVRGTARIRPSFGRIPPEPTPCRQRSSSFGNPPLGKARSKASRGGAEPRRSDRDTFSESRVPPPRSSRVFVFGKARNTRREGPSPQLMPTRRRFSRLLAPRLRVSPLTLTLQRRSLARRSVASRNVPKTLKNKERTGSVAACDWKATLGMAEGVSPFSIVEVPYIP